MESSVPAPGLKRWPVRQRLLYLLGGLALALFLYSPVLKVMDTTLDSSNYGSYTYFAANHFQYGPEVVPMSGPYGYVMYGSVYNGLLFWPRVVAQLLCAGAFAAIFLWFFHRSRASAWRWVWLLFLLVLGPVIEDLPFEWVMMLIGLMLLERPPRALATHWVVLTSSLLAFVALVKGTHLVLSLATLGVVLLGHAWVRDWRRGLQIALSYGAAFLLFWVLAGQDPRNIPSFLQGIRALTNGYNEAMALDEGRVGLLHGLFAAAALAAAFAWGGWWRRKDLTACAGLLLFAGFSFVKWKHGFVRADGHVYIFHHFTVVAAVFWFLYIFAAPGPADSRPVRWTGLTLMLTGILAGFWVESAKTSVLRLNWLATTWAPDHLKANVTQLLNLRLAKTDLDQQLALQRDTYVIPLSRQEVGGHSIDLFGIQHGIIPLNEMNYRPRPMGGGAFNTYSPYLMGLNLAFLQDPARRPDYYLVRYETIDNRLGTEDDGRTLLELLHRYEPLLIEQGHILMKSVPAAPEPTLRLLTRKVFKFGEFVSVPGVRNDELLVARFDIQPSLRGLIRSALYKPPLMFITMQGRNIEQPESRRFIPNMTASPFLFSPVVENNGDLAYLYTKRDGKLLTGFFLYSDDARCYQPEMTVEFYTMPRPVVPGGRDIDELLTATRFPIANVLPLAVIPDTEQQISLHGLLVQRLHAPGEIQWKMEGTEREFIFDYGFIPEAYERGASDGVVFIVEVRPPSGPPEVIFEKLLDPAHRTQDRGNHTARMLLPVVKPGSRLVLRTDPGRNHDNAWDWSYVTRMQIKRGNFSTKDFPVFSRAPESVQAEHAATIDYDGTKAYLLHVPGAVTFGLSGQERHLYLEFGFLPGAYTGEGRTNGANFVVELMRPGQPTKELYRRTLRPLTTDIDRGRQSADVMLPESKPGDKLVVRTDTVEGGSNSWGWTYLSRLTID